MAAQEINVAAVLREAQHILDHADHYVGARCRGVTTVKVFLVREDGSEVLLSTREVDFSESLSWE